MIESIKVRGFQALESMDLELGAFTVVVGPSDSGKSALMRSLRMLIGNAWEKSYVTQGASRTLVSATTEKGTITLERAGKPTDSYKIAPAEGREEVYTKLGGGVPEEVTKFLGMEPIKGDQSVNFAGQFDRPYLLTDSGSSVAAKLGELTNVSMIFEASREANRRKLEASKLLKTREADLAALTSNLSTFRDLPGRITLLNEIEASVTKLERIENLRAKLEQAITTFQISETAVKSAQAALDRMVSVEVDLGPLLEIVARIRTLKSLMSQLDSIGYDIDSSDTAVSDASRDEEEAATAYRAALEEQGHCPTCGSDVHSFHTERVL